MCYFRHVHVQTRSLYLGNTSTVARSISEKLESVGIKAAHLTSICRFPKDGGRAQIAHSLPLTMFSCLCSVPAPSSEPGYILWWRWRMSLCSSPCTALPRSVFPPFDFGAAFKLRWEPDQLGCGGIAAEWVPGRVTHWVPCWPGSCPIGSTSWLDLGPMSLLRTWLVILTLGWAWVPFIAGPAILRYHGNAPLAGPPPAVLSRSAPCSPFPALPCTFLTCVFWLFHLIFPHPSSSPVSLSFHV